MNNWYENTMVANGASDDLSAHEAYGERKLPAKPRTTCDLCSYTSSNLMRLGKWYLCPNHFKSESDKGKP